LALTRHLLQAGFTIIIGKFQYKDDQQDSKQTADEIRTTFYYNSGAGVH